MLASTFTHSIVNNKTLKKKIWRKQKQQKKASLTAIEFFIANLPARKNWFLLLQSYSNPDVYKAIFSFLYIKDLSFLFLLTSFSIVAPFFWGFISQSMYLSVSVLMNDIIVGIYSYICEAKLIDNSNGEKRFIC